MSKKSTIAVSLVLLATGIWGGEIYNYNKYIHINRDAEKEIMCIEKNNDKEIHNSDIQTEVTLKEESTEDIDNENKDNNYIEKKSKVDNVINSNLISEVLIKDTTDNIKKTSTQDNSINDDSIVDKEQNYQQTKIEIQTINNDEKEHQIESNIEINKRTDTIDNNSQLNPTPDISAQSVKQDEKQDSDNKVEVTTERQKIWHEPVYEDVWVVDDPGGDVVQYKSHTICYQCGFDFTANNYSQSDIGNHQSTYGCYSYGSEMVADGVKHYDEVGHYEKKLVEEGYWE